MGNNFTFRKNAYNTFNEQISKPWDNYKDNWICFPSRDKITANKHSTGTGQTTSYAWGTKNIFEYADGRGGKI